VSGEALKLTCYFGERDRVGGRFLADAMLGAFARADLATSVLLRGAEGFGLKQRLRTDRLLTLSEDLPVVAVGVDARERVEALAGEVAALMGGGLLTLERARTLDAPGPLPGQTRLTLYCGRGEPHRALVGVLARHGVAGATVLLGVDGTVGGRRTRARFLGHNGAVPVMLLAVGEGAAVARALPEATALLHRPVGTVERVDVLRRDGAALAPLPPVAPRDPSGLGVWQKVTVFSSEASGLHLALVRALREAGAAGVTVLRGVWGFHGDHAPHGDRLGSLRRHVPVVTVLVDRPDLMRRWLPVVERITADAGLVVAERVPALRAMAPGVALGGLRLARP
jgi:PII-like signaling protein